MPKWSVVLASTLLGAIVVAIVFGVANAIHLPYYEFHPGSARPVASLVAVEGAESFPVERPIAYTTVSLRQSTIASWLAARFDDDVEVRHEDDVLGDRSPTENRELNLQMMDTSKQDAVRSALVALGYDVPISIDGEIVVEVMDDSAAEGVLAPGDVVTAIDGEVLVDPAMVQEAMAGRVPGEVISLSVERADDGVERDVEIALSAAEDDPGRGIIGVFLQPRDYTYDFPFAVTIDSGNVGGPSAGLAFTLGVLDVLTPGDLTGGHDVAVTGTIDANGNVGLVGGGPQTTAAVVSAGYDVFLVPSDEVDQAMDRAGDGVQVIGVDTLDDALAALASLGGSGLPASTE